MSDAKLQKEFENGWKHFCGCIDFGGSALDAEAIRFMNEMPAKIISACKQHDKLLEACKRGLTYIDAVKHNFPRPILDLDYDRQQVNEAIAEATKEEK